jgi:NAD(P)-dependent dehydrogenase (short-subunit alcohol dehydrogenase family)
VIDLDGRRAVITGASRGIGYAVAEAYANAGAEVHIVSESRDIEEAAAVLRLGVPE